jgi:hypothetical protein
MIVGMHPSQVVIGHPTCDMELQRRIHESQRDAVARAVHRRSRRRGGRSLLDRVLGRHPSERPVELDAAALRDRGEDVWHSLRF